MSDASSKELIDNLQRSLRRWKKIALVLMVGLGLVIALGVGAATVQVQRMRAARDAEMDARHKAEEAQELAERNRRMARQTLEFLQDRVIEDAANK
jgi:uncharacterized protein HemX